MWERRAFLRLCKRTSRRSPIFQSVLFPADLSLADSGDAVRGSFCTETGQGLSLPDLDNPLCLMNTLLQGLNMQHSSRTAHDPLSLANENRLFSCGKRWVSDLKGAGRSLD